jgi:hypothetical protein
LERDFGSPKAVVSFQFPVVSRKLTLEQKGHPGKGVAFSFRENSSNGAKIRQNFLAKSYEPKKGGVKEFLGNKYLCFQ